MSVRCRRFGDERRWMCSSSEGDSEAGESIGSETTPSAESAGTCGWGGGGDGKIRAFV